MEIQNSYIGKNGIYIILPEMLIQGYESISYYQTKNATVVAVCLGCMSYKG